MSIPEPDSALNERLLHRNAVLRAIRNINQIAVRAADQKKVAQYVCQNLINTSSYRYTWIILLDSAGKPAYATGSGFDAIDTWLAAQSETGSLPLCAQRALSQPGVAITNNSATECNGCPLAAEAIQFSALSVRLAYQDELFGVMTVSMPNHISADFEEHSLLIEMASDIAFALHNIRLKDQRRQAEDKADRFAEIFENTLDEIYIFDAETLHFIEVNRGARQNLGYSLEELRQLTPPDLKPEFTRQNFEKLLAPLRSKEQSKLLFTASHRRKDGSLYPVEVHLQLSKLHDSPVFFAIIMDITERQKAEEALLQSEQRFRSLAEISRDYIMQYDAEGRHLYMNPAGLKVAGLNEADIVGKTHLEAGFDEEQSRFWEEKIDYVFETGQPFQVVFEWDSVAGPVFLDWRLTPELAADGTVKTVWGVSRDITNLKKAEAEIQLKNRALALLNRIISASAASLNLYEILKTACRELALFFEVPQAAAALLNPQRTEAVVRAEYLAEGRPSGLNHVIPAANNPVFDYLLTHKIPLVIDDTIQDPRLTPVRELIQTRGTVSMLLVPLMVHGKVVGSLGVDAIKPRTFSEADVDLARRVAEQLSGPLARAQMADRQRRLIAAVEQSAESMVITDLDANIIYVNPAFEKISGYTSAESLGQNPRILKSGVQDQAFYRKMWDTLTAGQVWRGHMVNKKKDGTLYTEEATITPVRNERGKIINYVAVKRDITAELSLQEQYYQAQKMESLGRLTGGVAHDFNNMLTAINGFAELLQMQMAADNPLLPMVDNILRSGNRATALVRQLLAFSRKQIIKPQTIDLNQIVADLDKMLRRVIGEDINLKTILAPNLSSIKIDPTQIEQILINLVVNARDAMPHGGKVTIETVNVTLDEAYVASHFDTTPGDYVMLAVSDTGPGISEEILKQIFEPFFTTKEQEKGTGLGLATVYGIVKQNHGDIRVYSELGVGTTFKVYFPVIDISPTLAYHSPADVEMSGNETILLVEDDEAVRLLVEQMLTELGYQVISAAGGNEVVRLASQHRDAIDLMLTDVVMPDISGKKLAEKLLAEIPGLKVLYMSGYTDNAIAHHGVLDAGIAFIAKPFSTRDLSVKLRELLDG